MASREQMSIQCSLSPSRSLSPSTAANPLVTYKQFACVCVYIHTCLHMYIRKYSCTRVTLRRVVLSSPPPALVGSLLLHKKLIASFDNQLHQTRGCFEICMRALGYDCSRRAGESSQGKVHRGHPLEEAIGPVCHLHTPPRSRSWAAVAPVNNSILTVKMDEEWGQPAEPRKLYRKSLGHAKLHCHCFVVGAWPLCVSGCRCR